jgi:7,8-dihydro-6-hydroxymethylpterin dimethyltransferase
MLSDPDERVLSHTESVCPECLARIPAQRVACGEDVYLRKTCADHGDFSAVIWRGQPAFASWTRPKLPSHPETPFTGVERGCPYDCGLCPDHRQQSCCILLEVTPRCDLSCPVCFADAGGRSTAGRAVPDPALSTIEGWYCRLLDAGGPFNVQLSGGEPCLRDDLPQIVALGRSLGFTFFQLNTNGLRLARDPDYLRRLVDAGLSTVFLQFDGTRDAIHARLRGRALADQKQAAIENCSEQGVGVVLVPTLVPGINVDDIGAIIEFALQYAPAVRGVHFQPISYFGRYPAAPLDSDRITLPEIIRAIEAQTRGAIRRDSFRPPGGENALCSFHGNFVLMPDGKLIPLTSRAGEKSCCSAPEPAKEGAAKSREFVALHWAAPPPTLESRQTAGISSQVSCEPSLGEWDTFLARARTHTFCISGMAFQDAWTLDLGRLRDCYIHVTSGADAGCRLVPFCAYNLTARTGRSLYRFAAVERRQGHHG